MVEFRYLAGAVYIFENTKAQRVKVGMTINDVADRLRSVNDVWLEHKVACQICGGRRLVNERGFIPKHVISGRDCPGGGALPIEKDVALAESHLENLKKSLSEFSGSEKGSVSRNIKKLEKRIELYRHYIQPVGMWQFRTAFYTECAEQVELLSHEILAERLDRLAPIGEVFCCSASEASEAVESALSQLGLLGSVRKEIRNDNTSEE
jgi:DNA-directed RNA polymerase subunit RPC12/RpoP